MRHTSPKIIDAVLAVTYICNSRCIMCNIWQNKNLPTLKVEDYLKLPATLRDINISGGEPFLRPDLAQVIANVVKACPKAKLIISTNGFATDLIISRMKEILRVAPGIGVSISLDGVGEKHNEVRRIPNGFNRAMETLDLLKQLGVKRLRIGFTAGDYNIEHLNKVYDLSREKGVEMTLAAVHNSEHYFKVTTHAIKRLAEFEREFGRLISSELKSFHPKRWLRAYFAHGLLHYVKHNRRILPSYAGVHSVYIDPDGWVFPADVSIHRLGNLKNFETLDALLNSPEAQSKLQKEDSPHWMICTARVAMRKHALKVLWWVVKLKLALFI